MGEDVYEDISLPSESVLITAGNLGGFLSGLPTLTVSSSSSSTRQLPHSYLPTGLIVVLLIAP